MEEIELNGTKKMTVAVEIDDCLAGRHFFVFH